MNRRYKLIVFLLLLFMLSGCVNKQESKEIEETKEIEKLENDIKYTLFSTIDVSNKQPYVFLVNADENTVYQQFKVYNDDTLLWSSLLVEPGKGETLNVYKMLDEGEYSLKVVVSSYSLEDKSLISSGVNLTQDIKIEKGKQ